MNYTVCDLCGVTRPSGDRVKEANADHEWEMCYGNEGYDFCPICWKKIEVFIKDKK